MVRRALERERESANLKTILRPDFTKGDQSFWDESQWTGIIACPFSSLDDSTTANPVEGIYFSSGSSSFDGSMHTVMGRSGHHLAGEKGAVLRAALLTPAGAPWDTKFKGYTCEVGVVPGYRPDLAKCLEENWGEYIYDHFQTAIPK